MLPKPQAYEELEEYAVSSGMHDLQEERDGFSVAVLVVLLERLWGLHASSDIDTGEGFRSVLGEGWEEW